MRGAGAGAVAGEQASRRAPALQEIGQHQHANNKHKQWAAHTALANTTNRHNGSVSVDTAEPKKRGQPEAHCRHTKA